MPATGCVSSRKFVAFRRCFSRKFSAFNRFLRALRTRSRAERAPTALMLRDPLQPIAIPLGGELDLVDGGTLAHSFAGRKAIAL